MAEEHIFITYSPLHYLTALAIARENNLDAIKIFVPHDATFPINPHHDCRIYFRAGSEASRWLKLFRLFRTKFSIAAHTTNHLYIPNDACPFTMLLKKYINYDQLHYIDEGITYLSRHTARADPTALSRSEPIKRLLGIESFPTCFTSREYTTAYVFFPDALQDERPDCNYVDLSALLNRHAASILCAFSISPRAYDLIVLTQPLTEDGHCGGYQEVDVIEGFVKENASLSILVKLHHRDTYKKYSSLESLPNVTIMRDYPWVPYQVLHSAIQPKLVASFISSALFSFDSESGRCARVSLVDRLNSARARCHEQALREVGVQFPDFRFSLEK